MIKKTSNVSASARQRQIALSRWENEGGAGPRSPQESSISGNAQSDTPELTNAELVQLRIRVIALENLVIALLAQASDSQLCLVREMAGLFRQGPGLLNTR